MGLLLRGSKGRKGRIGKERRGEGQVSGGKGVEGNGRREGKGGEGGEGKGRRVRETPPPFKMFSYEPEMGS